MKNLIALILISLLLAAGCRKKELPPAPDDDAVFFFKGEAGGATLQLEAGEGAYYMYSTKSRDSNSTRVFIGELRRTDCETPCDYSLKVILQDEGPSAETDPVHPERALKPGLYDFVNRLAPPTTFMAAFKPAFAEEPGSIFGWTITDGTGSTSYDDFGFNTPLDASKTYTVTFNYLAATGCQATHVNIINPASGLQPTVTAVKNPTIPAPTYSFSCNLPAASYFWEFGDGTTSEAWYPVHTYTTGNAFYRVKLTVVKDGNTSVTYYQVGGATTDCVANFNGVFTPVPLPVFYSRVIVELTKPDGTVFTSAGGAQPDDAKFEILSSEDFTTNERGERTRKLRVRFNCDGWNGADKIRLKSNEAVIAVSY